MSDPRYKVYTIYPGIDDRPDIEWLVEYLKTKGDTLSSVTVPELVKLSKSLQAKERISATRAI